MLQRWEEEQPILIELDELFVSRLDRVKDRVVYAMGISVRSDQLNALRRSCASQLDAVKGYEGAGHISLCYVDGRFREQAEQFVSWHQHDFRGSRFELRTITLRPPRDDPIGAIEIVIPSLQQPQIIPEIIPQMTPLVVDVVTEKSIAVVLQGTISGRWGTATKYFISDGVRFLSNSRVLNLLGSSSDDDEGSALRMKLADALQSLPALFWECKPGVALSVAFLSSRHIIFLSLTTNNVLSICDCSSQ